MSYVYSIVTVVAIFAVINLSLNLQFGQAGIINFGLVAYFAVGAYGYAILTQPPPLPTDAYALGAEMSPWLAAPLAVAAAALAAFLVGLPTLRLQGEYAALATFAFAQVVVALLINVRALGNGTIGFAQIAPPGADLIPFDSYDLWIMLAALLLLVLVYALVRRLTRSPFGAALQALRDDPVAAAALGHPVERLRMKAFVVGGALCGLAGVAYASYTTVTVPSLVTANVTFTAFIALVIGGVGSNVGAVVGAVIFFGLEELLRLAPFSASTARFVEPARLIPFGIALVVVLRFAPDGLAGLRPNRRRSAPPALDPASGEAGRP